MQRYNFFPVTILRTPAFSFKDYSTIKLRKILKNSYFQQALLIASSVIFRELEKVDFDFEKLNPKEKNTVQKYFNRICFRPTPFGAFSVFSVADWGQHHYIEVKKQRIHLTKSFAEEVLAGQVFRQSAGRNQLKYKANQTIYESAGELRYLAATANYDNTAFEFSIKSVTNIPQLKKLLLFSATERLYSELLEFLTGSEKIDSGEARRMLEELIDIQFFTDNLMPNITGRDYLERISAAFGPDHHLRDFKSTILPVLNSQISPGNSRLLNNSITDANKVYVNTEGIPGGSLNTIYQATIIKALNCLYCLNAKLPAAGNLTGFIAAYVKKFDGQTLPLLYVLDPETGIGYQDLADNSQGKELIQEINWTTKSKKELITHWSTAHSLLLKKWHHPAPGSKSVIKLEESDLALFRDEIKEAQTPPSISVIFRISNSKVLIESAGGASASALIGRFTPFNKQNSALGEAITQQESDANPGVIFAEIAHICNFHTANINRRSNIYKYEIPVLTDSTVPADFQIPLSDLYISVINGEVILYSQKNNKRVIPRLSSAFNYSKNDLSVFRFLCDLQHQGISSNLNFDLSTYFPDLNYYPRVEFLNSILHLATWRISKDEFKKVWNAGKEQRYNLFKKIKDQLSLPKWVALTVHDNQLVFNLTHNDEVEFFLQSIKNQETIIIKEFLYPSSTDDLFVTNKCKPLINQFIASLYHENPVYKAVNLPVDIKQKPLRRLSPGSEWLYFKIYCHPARANEIIAHKLFPLVKQFFKQNAIDEWFYIRYADPDFHIRFRLKVKKENFADVSLLINSGLNELIKKQKIASYTIAIYERELERYGYNKIAEFEKLFYLGSNVIATYLHLADTVQNQPEYYLFGFNTVRDMMDCFNLVGQNRISYLELLVNSFLEEFNGDGALKYQLDLKYRKLQEMLSAPATFYTPELQEANNAYKNALTHFYVHNKDQPIIQMNKWLADMVHMHLNRLFTDSARKQELVLYYLLLKYEKALFAKSKKAIAKRSPINV